MVTGKKAVTWISQRAAHSLASFLLLFPRLCLWARAIVYWCPFFLVWAVYYARKEQRSPLCVSFTGHFCTRTDELTILS
jgi:hypothetical protein